MADDEHFELLCKMTDELFDDIVEEDNRRNLCERCDRPMIVCLCPYFPKETITLNKNIKIWIFQHPFEIKRCLRTTRILEKCVDPNNFEIIISKKFTIEKFPVLKEVYENEHTYLLYPSKDSISIENLPKFNDNVDNYHKIHIIILDGTWNQASGIYFTNPILQKLKQVKIDNNLISAYRIRTQPREFYLSTVETVALTISKLEDNESIYKDLVKPLEALCDYQFNYGAVAHQSKEFMIINGLYKKPISKKNLNKLTHDSKLIYRE